MTIFYSKKTNGFRTTSIHKSIPSDCVIITDEEYRRLLRCQESGMVIKCSPDGYPVAVENTPTKEQESCILKQTARNLLEASDINIIRCIEDGITPSAELVQYRTLLREIVSGESDSTAVPEKPTKL